MGTKSIKTDSGTAYYIETKFVSVTSWDSALAFILENEYWHLLKKDVAGTASKDLIEKGTIIPGVEMGSKIDLRIKAPTAKRKPKAKT